MPTWYLGAYNLYNLSGVPIVRRNSAYYAQQIMFDVGFEIKVIHKKELGYKAWGTLTEGFLQGWYS